MSKMINWAEEEIKRRVAIEDEGSIDKEYTELCCQSALKALKCLSSDGHSGFSIGVTMQILDRLVEFKPLTPLTGEDDEWVEEKNYAPKRYKKVYRNKRMSSLSKYILLDDTVAYCDHDRATGVDMNNGCTFGSGYVTKIVDDLFPITFPYYPSDRSYLVYCEDFLVDPKNGDFDTRGFSYLKKPNGDKVDLNIYHSYDNDVKKVITKEEYEARKEKAKKRMEEYK